MELKMKLKIDISVSNADGPSDAEDDGKESRCEEQFEDHWELKKRQWEELRRGRSFRDPMDELGQMHSFMASYI